MAFAEHTKVPVEQTRMEIERTLARYGAQSFAWFVEPKRASLQFEAHKRRVRFDLPVPPPGNAKDEKTRRQRWRALLLCIKAKLESVDSQIETFEEAFLAHVVMPAGGTVYDHAKERISAVYGGGEMQPLLPPPRSS
jgi:hypothetical protein